MVSQIVATGREAASNEDPAQSLSRMMRSRTAGVHRAAERSGIVADILTGKASRFGYALLLANLLPVYEALEQHDIAGGKRAELRRTAAIEADLAAIAGAQWHAELRRLASGIHYADRIRASRIDDGALLLAHAYVRYLGDLSGGLVLARLLERHLDLQPHQLSFYQFPGIADVAAYKDGFRRALDATALDSARQSRVADEAVAAFEFNIALSLEVQAVVRAQEAP